MLVLSRKENQWITIGDDIRICVVNIDRNKIRIGIEAPKGVKIMREELLEEDDGGVSMDDRGHVEGVIGVLPH